MDFLPLFARLKGQRCLVIGGGEVAHRKVLHLLRAGARVSVNAPDLNPALAELAGDRQIDWYPGRYDPALVAAHLLVIAATPDRDVNAAIASDCAGQQRLCNVVDDGELSGFIMPSVVDRSPLVIAVSTGGRSPVLARIIRQRIDAWLPARMAELVEWAGRWRAAAKRQVAGHAKRLRFWQDLLDGEAGEALLAGNRRRADALVAAALGAAAGTAPAGEAWIVGAGPGDPELITQRGLRLLQKADVVLHDRLIAPALLDAARRDAEIICVGKSPDGPSTSQADINALLVDRVRAGRRVCRLKGGDPFIFGRGGEEIEALAQAGLPYQVVPGITAAQGCAASAGIPLTHRDHADAVTLVTASRAADAGPVDWRRFADGRQTLIVYMGARRLAAICAELIEHGRSTGTPAAVIMRGTTGAQRVVGGTLADIAARCEADGIAAPAVMVVGTVAALAGKLAWFDGDDAGGTSGAPEMRAASGQ